MLAYNGSRQMWVRIHESADLEQNIWDELGMARSEYDALCELGVDAHDPRRAKIDAHMTGLEKLLDWSE